MVQDRGGHAKSGLATTNLHVRAHWNLSGSVGAWASLLETSETARIFKSHYVHDAFCNQSLRLYLLRKLCFAPLKPK